MNDQTHIKLLEYLDGSLPDYERRALERRLAEDHSLRQALDELRLMLFELDNLPEQTPAPDLAIRFDQYLNGEKNALKPSNASARPASMLPLQKTRWDAAAAIALLLIGVGFGWLWHINQRRQAEIQALRTEIKQTQQMLVLAMLEKPSASERIRAVNLLEKEQTDPKIIGALVYTMNFDDMSNVRMKAAQALGNFDGDPAVRDALINSLHRQDSPEVQIAIIDALVSLGEKRAVPVFQHIMEDKDLMDIVRKKAASGIAALL